MVYILERLPGTCVIVYVQHLANVTTGLF